MARMEKGTVTNWKDKEGYGFIMPDGDGEDVFFHISALGRSQRRPADGDHVRYRAQMDETHGRPRATQARLDGLAPSLAVQFGLGLWLAGVLFLALTAVDLIHPSALLAAYVALNLLMSPVTFEVYGIDKRRASDGRWRIPEATLHLMELCGGWIGAGLAQRYFRHKVKKLSYLLVYGLIVVINVVFVVVVIF